jgi:hypothetical protein
MLHIRNHRSDADLAAGCPRFALSLNLGLEVPILVEFLAAAGHSLERQSWNH